MCLHELAACCLGPGTTLCSYEQELAFVRRAYETYHSSKANVSLSPLARKKPYLFVLTCFYGFNFNFKVI